MEYSSDHTPKLMKVYTSICKSTSLLMYIAHLCIINKTGENSNIHQLVTQYTDCGIFIKIQLSKKKQHTAKCNHVDESQKQ